MRRRRNYRRGMRSPFVCHKFISVVNVNTDKVYFEIAPKASDFDQVAGLLNLYKRYRSKNINVRYRSDIRGAMATCTDLGHACVRLSCSPIVYENEFSNCTETDCLRIGGFYREFVLQRDFAVNGSTSNPSRNPWLADPAIPHYGLFFKFCNPSPEFQKKVKRSGKLYITAYIRDRKLAPN
ncbi:hypothetical protein AHF37_03930 [Paragonimus kellicotti]|nr:hypothetical protein AHF37_03930 [Paragonimus kellicotti]